MKIKGFEPGTLTKQEIIERPEGALTVILSALPIGTLEAIEDAIPPPQPPQVGWERTRGDKGTPIKDDLGRMIPRYNLDDPKYKMADARTKRLQNVLMIRQGLRADEQIVFETREKDYQTPRAYAEALHKELVDFGFSFGDLGRLIAGTIEVSGVSTAKLRDAREAFLPPTLEESETGQSASSGQA